LVVGSFLIGHISAREDRLFHHITRRRLVASAIAAGAATTPEQSDAHSDESLPQAAARTNRYFGAAVRIEQILQEDDLRGAVLRECTHLTPEVALKWDAIEPSRGSFRFGPMDGLLAFAEQQGMRLHGHTLLWHGGVPRWAEELLPEQRSWSLVQRYLEAVLGRYRDRIRQWDVVNEPIETGYRMDGLRNSVFLKAFGPDYIPRALWEARRLAPRAELMINEFALEYDTQVDHDRRYHFLKLIERLKQAGAPLDGIGLQSHLELGKGQLATGAFSQLLEEIANFGLFIVVTELDVKEHDYILPIDQRDRRVADATARYLDLVLAHRAVRGVITWGLSDRHSWLEVTPQDFARYPNAWKDGTRPGLNRGLPFDASMRRKPIYWAISNALRKSGT
jgi:endo-1,4-beta-xylanase